MDYSVLVPQESHSLNTANPRQNKKTMSSASFSLASVWLANPINIQREEMRVGSGVNNGSLSDDQMAWNVVNGADRSFWNSICNSFYMWFTVTAGVRLIFLKIAVFRRRSVKKGPNEVNLVKILIYFIKYFSWGIFG